MKNCLLTAQVNTPNFLRPLIPMCRGTPDIAGNLLVRPSFNESLNMVQSCLQSRSSQRQHISEYQYPEMMALVALNPSRAVCCRECGSVWPSSQTVGVPDDRCHAKHVCAQRQLCIANFFGDASGCKVLLIARWYSAELLVARQHPADASPQKFAIKAPASHLKMWDRLSFHACCCLLACSP